MKRVAVLGSTGSVGRNTLAVLRGDPEAWQVAALAGGGNAAELSDQVREFEPELVVAGSEAVVRDVQARLARLAWRPRRATPRFLTGAAGLLEAAGSADVVVNALVGAVGLAPSLAAVSRPSRLALANKESLVLGGALLRQRARASGAEILPIDSEHSGLWQCLAAGRADQVARVTLTASGGPLLRHRDWRKATPPEVLAHPVWRMGPRITTDSATLLNKGFEVIEAHWLFDLPLERIEVLVHPQAVVHALVEWRDGSVLAQLSPPDMRLPIQVALTWPERGVPPAPRLDLAAVGRLDFQVVDPERFPAFATALLAARAGGVAPAVLNAADEVLVALFLEERLPLGEVVETLRRVVESHPRGEAESLEAIAAADRWARQEAMRVAVGA